MLIYLTRSVVPLRGGGGGGAPLGRRWARAVLGICWRESPSAVGLDLSAMLTRVLHFSELGVVFDASSLVPNSIRPALATGALSSASALLRCCCAAVLAGLLMLAYFLWQAAVVGGYRDVSTAMALQLMREKGMNRSESAVRVSGLTVSGFSGDPRAGVGALLAITDEHFDWFKVAMKVLAFAVRADWRSLPAAPGISFYCCVRRGRPHCRDAVAGVERRLFMDALGLSMSLGTFIAGVLLAESEYRMS